MRVSTQAFHAPKKGNSEAEYEDAFFPDGCEREVAEFRCAVADGASESAFAQIWAALLVRGFATRQMHLEQLRQEWLSAIKGQSLPWFLERKVKRGAFAAFVGLSIRANGRHHGNAKAAEELQPDGWLEQHGVKSKVQAAGTWRVLAIGDSCVFQVRGDELVTVGPVCRSSEFDNSPYLLGSKSKELLRRSAENVTVLTGQWARQDKFYLATDAMAQWILAQHEAGKSPWEMLRALGMETTRPFDELVQIMRADRGLHNDDTTLLRIEVA